MQRNEAVRDYDWHSMQARVRLWYESRRLAFMEAPIANIDTTFGVTHRLPRTSTLLVKLRHGANTTFVVVLTPAAVRADLTSIRKMFGASTAWMASFAEVCHHTGAVPGCVPAFGSLFHLPLIVDAQLRHTSTIFTASGRPGFAVRVPMREYMRSENPLIVDVTRGTRLAVGSETGVRVDFAASASGASGRY